MSLCYSFEKHINVNSMFEGYIDAVYVIHLEGNGRIENIKKQLQEYKLARDVYIVYNKGYKKCDKPDNIKSSNKDIIDVNKTVYRDALSKNYKTILVLEDDFIINPEIAEKEHIKNIKKFLRDNQNTKYIYYLGALPLFSYPYDNNNHRCKCCYTAHSVIYSDLMLKDIMQKEYILDKHEHIDEFLVYEYIKEDCTFHYHKPLIYQIFPLTENRKQWHTNKYRLHKHISDYFIKWTNFDKNPEPGTKITYLLSHIMFYTLLIFLMTSIAMLIYFFDKNAILKTSNSIYLTVILIFAVLCFIK